MQLEGRTRWMALTAIALSALIFVIDLYTPLGIADGISYIVVVLLTIWMREKYSTLILVASSVLLIIAGYFLSPPGENLMIVLTNRFISVFGVIISGVLIVYYKKSQEELLNQKSNLDAIFQNATEGIVIINEKGEITMANPRMEEQFGYTQGEMKGQMMETLIPGWFVEKHIFCENAVRKAPGKNEKNVFRKELMAKKIRSEKFPVEVGLASCKINNEDVDIAFVLDISDRKKQEAAIAKVHDELKVSHGELEVFAFVASHDLQEPLRKILSFGERVKSIDSEKLSEQGKDYLSRILNAATRMQQLINDLLSYSRLTTRAGELEKTDLGRIAKEVLADLEVAIEKSGAKVSVGELPVIMGDATQMRQLFQNILSNSIKFRKENEKAEIKISSVLSGSSPGFYELKFEDNGIGFHGQYAEKIFEFFQRLEGKKYEGSGIGLAVVKKIVERHKGNISVKSEQGKGSVFTVSLPAG